MQTRLDTGGYGGESAIGHTERQNTGGGLKTFYNTVGDA